MLKFPTIKNCTDALDDYELRNGREAREKLFALFDRPLDRLSANQREQLQAACDLDADDEVVFGFIARQIKLGCLRLDHDAAAHRDRGTVINAHHRFADAGAGRDRLDHKGIMDSYNSNKPERDHGKPERDGAA